MDYIFDSGTGCAAPTRGYRNSALRAAALLALAATLPGAAPLAALEVRFEDVRSVKGVLRICLTRAAEDFPDCKDGTGIARTISAKTRTLRVENLVPGTYALAVIHDENANARLDTFIGIPREGFGFSRNPGIGFGPPRFKAVQFDVSPGGAPQRVKMRYLL